MPKFTMQDVDKRIEEIREKYRQPKPVNGKGILGKLLQKARGTKEGITK